MGVSLEGNMSRTIFQVTVTLTLTSVLVLNNRVQSIYLIIFKVGILNLVC